MAGLDTPAEEALHVGTEEAIMRIGRERYRTARWGLGLVTLAAFWMTTAPAAVESLADQIKWFAANDLLKEAIPVERTLDLSFLK